MNCANCIRYLSPYLDGELDRETRERAEDHLRSCQSCQRELEKLARVVAQVDETVVELPTPAGFTQATMAKVSAAAQARGWRQQLREVFVVKLGESLKPRNWVPAGSTVILVALVVVGTLTVLGRKVRNTFVSVNTNMTSTEAESSLSPLELYDEDGTTLYLEKAMPVPQKAPPWVAGAPTKRQAAPGGMSGAPVRLTPGGAPTQTSPGAGMPAVPGPAPPALMPKTAKPSPTSAPPPPIPLDKNGYYGNTYMGGQGSRDRVEKLIASGVVVSGKQVKLAAFPRRYGQAFRIPRRTALNLEATTERTKIVSEGDSTYLQVGLQAIKREGARRPPLNIALALDVSGSMGDENKLVYAKAAAARLVDRLSPRDRLALVLFESTVKVAIPTQGVTDKQRYQGVIAAVTPGSNTDLYGGLSAAYQEAAKHLAGDGINQVILLSDGLPTAGVSDVVAFRKLAEKYVEKGITTTTVGVGVDFNEELMMGVAEEGKGNYHFLKDSSSTDRVFQQEFQEMANAVAKALRLRLRLADGIELLKVFGSQALSAQQTAKVKADEKRIDKKVFEDLGIVPDRQKQKEEPGIKMLIPHFYQNDSHVIMLQVRVPKGRGSRKVADVYLKYKDLVFAKNRSEHVAVSVDYTSDKTEMVRSAQRAVVKNRLGFETGEALIQAARFIEQTNLSAAVRTLDERMVVLGVAAKEWNDRDLDRDGALLAQYKTVVAGLDQRFASNPELGQYLRKSLTYSGYELTR